MSLLAAGAVFFGWNELEAGKHYQILGLDLGTLKAADGGEGDMMQWGDAIGLGAFAVIGAMNGIRANSPILITCLCGMMTCTFGGLTRDTLLNRPVRILHPYSDAYASIAFSGAVGYVTLRTLAPAQQALRIGGTVLGVVMARKVTWENGYRLPYWGSGCAGAVGLADKNVVTKSGTTGPMTTIVKHTVTYGTSDPRATTVQSKSKT
jgi:Glycine transporter